MRVTGTKGTGSGASSVLLSSEAVPEPEGLGMPSSLELCGWGFLVASLGKNLSLLIFPRAVHPVGRLEPSEKKHSSKRF